MSRLIWAVSALLVPLVVMAGSVVSVAASAVTFEERRVAVEANADARAAAADARASALEAALALSSLVLRADSARDDAAAAIALPPGIVDSTIQASLGSLRDAVEEVSAQAEVRSVPSVAALLAVDVAGIRADTLATLDRVTQLTFVSGGYARSFTSLLVPIHELETGMMLLAGSVPASSASLAARTALASGMTRAELASAVFALGEALERGHPTAGPLSRYASASAAVTSSHDSAVAAAAAAAAAAAEAADAAAAQSSTPGRSANGAFTSRVGSQQAAYEMCHLFPPRELLLPNGTTVMTNPFPCEVHFDDGSVFTVYE